MLPAPPPPDAPASANSYYPHLAAHNAASHQAPHQHHHPHDLPHIPRVAVPHLKDHSAFNTHLMQKFPLETELHPPHFRLAIPHTTVKPLDTLVPEIIKPGLARLLLDLQCFVIDAARNGTLVLAKRQR